MRLRSYWVAAVLLSHTVLASFAAAGSPSPGQSVVTGFVVPSEVGDKEPFTFATSGGVVEGEVISIQTVEGEVVATKKTDKFGRIFLATGLATGSYLLTRGAG